MAGGQLLTGSRGSVSYGLTVALVGLALTAGQGSIEATGDSSALLSGHAITSEQGTLSQSGSATLIGIERDLFQGFLGARGRSLVSTFTGTTVPDAQLPLTGQSVAGEQGTITAGADSAPTLSGQTISASIGTVTPTFPRDVTGEALTSADGTLALLNTPITHTGQLLTGDTGTIEPSGFTVTAHLSGQEFTVEQGSVDATPVLSGSEATLAVGTSAPTSEMALSGQVVTLAQGATVADQSADDTFITSRQGTASVAADVALSGSAITSAQGTVTTQNIDEPISGSESASAIGTVTPNLDYALTGQEIASELQSMGAPGYGIITGQVITTQQGAVFTDTDRTIAITGSAMTLAIGSVGANPRQAITTQLINSGIGTLGRSGGTMAQALTGQRVTLTQGSVGVIGQSPVQQTPSLEGCGITSGVAIESVTSEKTASSEGCFITANSANEVA